MIKELKAQGFIFECADCDLDFIDSDIIEFESKDVSLIVSEHDGCFLIFRGGVKPKSLNLWTMDDLLTTLKIFGIEHNIKIEANLFNQ